MKQFALWGTMAGQELTFIEEETPCTFSFLQHQQYHLVKLVPVEKCNLDFSLCFFFFLLFHSKENSAGKTWHFPGNFHTSNRQWYFFNTLHFSICTSLAKCFWVEGSRFIFVINTLQWRIFCDSKEQYPWDWKCAKRNNPTLQKRLMLNDLWGCKELKVKKAKKQIPAVFKVYFWSIWKNTRVRQWILKLQQQTWLQAGH